MSGGAMVDRASGIGIRFVRGWTIEPASLASSYAMTVFACGRAYEGRAAAVKAAVQRHAQSGCKRCRRAERRRLAIAASRFAIDGSRAAF